MSAASEREKTAAAVRELGALPMPVGPGPLPQGDDRAKAPWGRGEDGRPMLPMGAHWTDIPELVDQRVARIQARVDQAQPGHWYDASATETWRAPGTVCTRVEGYHRTVGQCTNMQPADLELVLHAHDDLSWCLDMMAKLRARVAELESERNSTNEALDDAVQALRARAADVSADKLTRLLAPTQAPGEVEAAEADRIVAYRDPSRRDVLLCREHGAPIGWVNPVTSEDLPDGGFCTYGRMTGLECGRDVLAEEHKPGGAS